MSRYCSVHLAFLSRAVLMAMGLLWLPIEAYEGLTNADIELPYWTYLLGSVSLGFLIFTLDGHFVGGFLKNEILISSNTFDTKILVTFGNLFDQEGWMAIAVNDFFDCIVDDDLVSRNSLHGEVITRYWRGDGNTWKDQIYSDLHDNEFELIDRTKGNVKRYRTGTTARANSGNSHFLFVALGKTNIDDNVTQSTAESLIVAVRQMLVRARSVCANQRLNVPLFGSGLSRVGIKSSVLVDLILTAIIEETKMSKITDTIVLVLPSDKKTEIDLGEIVRSWS